MSDDDRPRNGTRRPREEARTDGPARVTPHDLNAERALLGAAMLAPAALDVLARQVKPEDFYSPGNAAIAAALVELHGREVKPDLVLVRDALARRGTLELAGGATELMSIMSGTPATTSASHYAALVRDHATLRRVIAAAGEIAEIGYAMPSDAHEAVVRAQSLLSALDDRDGAVTYSTLDFGDLDSLLNGTLIRIDPDFLYRVDGQALFYAGRMHYLHGEPSGGKSWIALQAALEVLRIGGAVLYLDYEDSLSGIVGRLLALGAEPDDLRGRFVYVKQDGPFGPAEKLELAARIRTLNPDLVIIDGVAEALSRDGLSEDKAPDVVAWTEKLPRWLARFGAAVVMLDHVAKDRESRGRWQRGSGAKLAAVDGSAYEVIVRQPFSRKRAGKIDLKIAKDRPGGVGEVGSVATTITITPYADGDRVVLEVLPPEAHTSTADPWKPTILMKRVTDELERAVTPLTSKAVVDLIGASKPKLVREAIERLTSEGWIRQAKAGSATFLYLVRAYSEDEAAPPKTAPAPTLNLDGAAEGTESPDQVTNVVVGPWAQLSQYERDRILLDGAEHVDRLDPEDPGPDEGDQ